MIYILLSICCSVTVAVLLKLARRYKINIVQAVTWNYFFAIIFGFLTFKPKFEDLTLSPSPVYIALGILLPLIFWFLAASIRNIGIVKTDIAQRLSLFIPVFAAYFLFKEHLGVLKLSGLIIGIAAVLCTLIKPQQGQSAKINWLFPVIVFLGFGTIDILFKQVSQIQTIPYTTSLIVIFSLSFLVSLVSILYLRLIKKEKLELINFICGCILGTFNFGNILFYLNAHKALADNPSIVFAVMNMGVIIFGSLIGIVVFKEKFSKINYIGLLLALTSIIIITLSKIYAV